MVTGSARNGKIRVNSVYAYAIKEKLVRDDRQRNIYR